MESAGRVFVEKMGFCGGKRIPVISKKKVPQMSNAIKEDNVRGAGMEEENIEKLTVWRDGLRRICNVGWIREWQNSETCTNNLQQMQ